VANLIIVSGNPVDGFVFYGDESGQPITDHDAASELASWYLAKSSEPWHIVDLLQASPAMPTTAFEPEDVTADVKGLKKLLKQIDKAMTDTYGEVKPSECVDEQGRVLLPADTLVGFIVEEVRDMYMNGGTEKYRRSNIVDCLNTAIDQLVAVRNAVKGKAAK